MTASSTGVHRVALKSKAPPYSPHRDNPHEGDNIGMRITDTRSGKKLFYAPGLGEIEPHVKPLLEEADAVMVDGTFWTDDEMIQLGISKKRARDIGHLPQSGPGGMIEVLKPLRATARFSSTSTTPIRSSNEDSARACRTRAAPASRSPTTEWTSRSRRSHGCSREHAQRPGAERNSSSSCARRAGATTFIIPTKSR